MVDDSEFTTFRNDPAFAGMTDEQIRQLISSPGAVVNENANLDFGMQGGQGMNLSGSPSMSAINYGNSLQDPYAYSSMGLAPGSNLGESTDPNQSLYKMSQQNQSPADESFRNTGPGSLINTVTQGVNLVSKVKPLLGTGGLKGILGKIGGGAGLPALAPLAPLALGAGLLMYRKHKKKKRKEAREAKEEAQYKSRKLEQKQDLIDANTDYMEMASKYNNTYDIS